MPECDQAQVIGAQVIGEHEQGIREGQTRRIGIASWLLLVVLENHDRHDDQNQSATHK